MYKSAEVLVHHVFVKLPSPLSLSLPTSLSRVVLACIRYVCAAACMCVAVALLARPLTPNRNSSRSTDKRKTIDTHTMLVAIPFPSDVVPTRESRRPLGRRRRHARRESRSETNPSSNVAACVCVCMGVFYPPDHPTAAAPNTLFAGTERTDRLCVLRMEKNI